MGLFSLEGETVEDVAVESVYDGDTCTLRFAHGPDHPLFRPGACTTWHCRLAGINCPEVRPPKDAPGREAIVTAAHRARDRLVELLGDGSGWRVRCGPFDKYGRVLVRVLAKAGGESANDTLLREGHAVVFMPS